MIPIEVFGGVVIAVMLVVTAGMAIIGLLGASGALRLGRCRACGHFIVAPSAAQDACPYCRHPWMARAVVPVHLRHRLAAELVNSRITRTAGRGGPGRYGTTHPP